MAGVIISRNFGYQVSLYASSSPPVSFKAVVSGSGVALAIQDSFEVIITSLCRPMRLARGRAAMRLNDK